MRSIQQLRWKDVLNDVLFPSDISFDWIDLRFSKGYTTYDRDGLYVHGPYGDAEVTPLPRYYDDEIGCLLAAIDTVSKKWPEKKRDRIDMNALVANDYDLDTNILNNYSTIKVKVHTLQDCERVKKVREICRPDTKIRIDCNGRFSVDEALAIVEILRDVDLEFVEQPCRTNKKCAKFRKKSNVRVAIDETARTHEEIIEIKKLAAADIILVKVQPAGGIHKAVELIDNWDSDVIIAHMMETKVGVDVGIALAQSLDKLDYACGLVPMPLENVMCEPFKV